MRCVKQSHSSYFKPHSSHLIVHTFIVHSFTKTCIQILLNRVAYNVAQMNYIIRNTALLSFIFSVGMLAGCGGGHRPDEITFDPTRPLKTPEATASRPKIVAFGDSLTA